MIEWLTENWLRIVIPVVAFLAIYVAGLWLRRVIDSAFANWVARSKWVGSRVVARAVHRPSLSWVIMLSLLVAVQVSTTPAGLKLLTVKIIGSLFILTLVWTITFLTEQLIRLYFARLKVPRSVMLLIINVTRVTVILAGVLIVLDIWGLPTSPLLLLIGVAVLALALLFRNAAPDLFAGFQLASSEQIKVGDYIKLQTGEEGYVTAITWSTIQIKALDGSTVSVPNSRLLQHTVVNYGRQLKKAKEAFRFNTRTHLTELTGLRARNLRELADYLKKAPDSVVYFHTHHFLEEQHYLRSEPSNDFALWVADALGDEVMGERLAAVDTFAFPTMGALRERLVAMIEEYLATGSNFREAMPGREFYFMKSVSVILPTPYVVHDLRELAEALRKISLGSLYYHIFESRLRLGRGLNDFSIWLQDSLGEKELADEIAQLDPYTYTLEGLRSALIQRIEKHIR